jgi:transmembrane sensor
LCVVGWLWIHGRSEVPARLALAQGGDISTLAVPAAAPSTAVSLTDGSRIKLAPDSRVEVLENDGQTFRTVLRHGSGTFDVRPGGPRKWTVECAGVTVEVVGTRFTLARTGRALRVEVDHGVVVVRGPHIADRVLRLTAGQSAEVPTEDDDAARRTESASTAASCAPEPPAVDSVPVESAQPRALDAVAAPRAAPSYRDPVDVWMHNANAARARGDVARAAQLLRQVTAATRPSDPRRALAAFTLAQTEMKDHPDQAAATLSGALDAGVPSGMQEDSWARLVQAYASANDLERARQAAREYERRYPNGSRLDEVRHWARGQE